MKLGTEKTQLAIRKVLLFNVLATKKKPTHMSGFLFGESYWIRTSDLCPVKAAL